MVYEANLGFLGQNMLQVTIATTLEANFPGLKSNQLGESEVKAIVDALCVDAATRNGMNPIEARAIFNGWLQQQAQDLENEELARLWMNQMEVQEARDGQLQSS